MTSAFLWLFLDIISLIFLAFFSMSEMAAVSFNPLRLEFLATQKHRRAQWIHTLMKTPSHLFGTTLFGVNVTMFIGSECARRFCETIGMSPDDAVLPQVLIVVLFGELTPMLAARHFSEHVSLLVSPLLFFFSKLLLPFNTLLHLFTKHPKKNSFYSREEILKMVEQQHTHIEDAAFQLLNLKNKKVTDLLLPMNQIPKLPTTATIYDIRHLLRRIPVPFLAIYHKNLKHVIALVSPRDILKGHDKDKVRDFLKTPWFLTQNMAIPTLIQQFKRNRQSAAIILNDHGEALGILTLESIWNELFGRKKNLSYTQLSSQKFFLDRSFPGTLSLHILQKEFSLFCEEESSLSLSEFFVSLLGHFPEEKENVFIGGVELSAEKISSYAIETIHIKTHLFS